MNKQIKKEILIDPLKLEWDKNKGKLTRNCKVCQKPFKVEHWRQTTCKETTCKEYSFRFAHIKASFKRWEDIVKQVKALGFKPSFTFTNNKETK